jgi:hypothetical protein
MKKLLQKWIGRLPGFSFIAIMLPLLLFPLIAIGHHSVAEYDRNNVLELEGEILRVHWNNPHVGFTMAVVNADGSTQTWALEAQDRNSQDRRGVPHDLLQVGAIVRAAGYPSTRRHGFMFMTNILLPDGRELVAEGGGQPRWSQNVIGGPQTGDEVLDPDSDLAESADGIFRVWMRKPPPGRFPRPLPLTSSAEAARAPWNAETDDFIMRCVTPGMPFAMLGVGPHPIDFTQRDGDIVIHAEYFDIIRLVHMNPAADANPPASELGYSTGRWEGDSLVVRTTQINWPFFDRTGVPQSMSSEILERFTPSEDFTELAYDITVEDPENFTEPVTARWTWEWHPELEVEPYECISG